MIENKKLIKILPIPLVVTKEQSLVSANKVACKCLSAMT